jgi:hypothetical protein
VGREIGPERGRSADKKAGLSNITQFSRGRRVLRSGGPNHVNLYVHRVHP